jgi:N-acetylmuramoyl-L-alanine amidase
MANKILVLDPGHGGSDPGAVGNGLLEKVLTLDIANRTRRYLETYFNGITIYMTRETDKTLSLDQRSDFVNSKKADLFASIHINAGGGTGYEDYIWNGNVGAETTSAQATIHNAILKEISGFGIRDRGKKRANFHMLRETHPPALLSENMFIDTPADSNLLKRSDFLEAIAKGHALGLAEVLKLSKKVVQAPKPTPTPAPSNKADTHRVIVDGKQVGAYSDDINVLNEVSKALRSPAKKIVIEEV